MRKDKDLHRFSRKSLGGNMEQEFICDYQCEKCIGGCFGDGRCYK